MLTAADVPLTFGRYDLRGLIGAGGMGEVYDGWDPTLGRPVAMKALPARREAGAAKERFRREVTALARLEHPNVVTLFDAQLDVDRPFLVMERLRGKNLGELVRTEGPRPVGEALLLVAAAARGLAAVHAAGLIHRDVKPDNLFLTADGVLKVIDLGVSGFTAGDGIPTLTADGTAVGTADYVAPEQLDGEAGPPADVYALGGTLHFLLTGRSPFAHHPTTAARLKAHRTEAPSPPPGVPAGVAALVRQMLAKGPADRPADMTRIAERAELLGGRGGKTARSAGWVAVSAFSLLVAVAAIATWSAAMTLTWIAPDELRNICLAVAAVAGVFGAVFAALRWVCRRRWLTVVVGVLVSVGLIAGGIAIWRGYRPATTPPAAPRFTTQAELWRAVADHLEQNVAAADRPRARVVSLAPVANRPGVTADVLNAYRAALTEWVAAPVEGGGGGGATLVPIGDSGLLFLLLTTPDGLSDLGWDRLLNGYPYGLRADAHPDPAVKDLAARVYEATGAEIPIVRGDWLLAASRRPGEWQADANKPLGLADLSAELGLADSGPLADWVRRHPAEAARFKLAPLVGNGTISRAALGERTGAGSVFQRVATDLRLGTPVDVTVE